MGKNCLGVETVFDMDEDLLQQNTGEACGADMASAGFQMVPNEGLAGSVLHLKECLENMLLYQPKISNLIHVDPKDTTKVSPEGRNQSAYTLKCLTSFFGYPHEVFSLALNTLDRFIMKVKVQPRYLSCITTTCFYHAAQEYMSLKSMPRLEKLIRLSQTECRPGDIQRMQKIIMDKLRPPPDEHAVTALTLFNAAHAVLAALCLPDVEPPSYETARSQLLQCLCHVELQEGVSIAMLPLAIISVQLNERRTRSMDPTLSLAFSRLLSICEVCERDFVSYEERIATFLSESPGSLSSLSRPRAQLRWTISNRTMSVLRPSSSWATDLSVIHEATLDELREFEMQQRSESAESLDEDDGETCELPVTPTPDDFNQHFSYPNSPNEGSPLSNGLPVCPVITYAAIVAGRIYRT